jgi:hypothetical protein
MSEQTHATKAKEEKATMWATGLALFAGVLLITIGIFQAIAGFAAILEDRFYIVTRNYAYEIDVTAWGWIHLGLGILLGLTGWGIIAGQLWARVVGIGLAVLSAIANFLFIPYYPVWSLLIIALDVFVIWALCVYVQRAAELAPPREAERVEPRPSPESGPTAPR